jgi:hypothetical protein
LYKYNRSAVYKILSIFCKGLRANIVPGADLYQSTVQEIVAQYYENKQLIHSGE